MSEEHREPPLNTGCTPVVEVLPLPGAQPSADSNPTVTVMIDLQGSCSGCTIELTYTLNGGPSVFIEEADADSGVVTLTDWTLPNPTGTYVFTATNTADSSNTKSSAPYTAPTR